MSHPICRQRPENDKSSKTMSHFLFNEFKKRFIFRFNRFEPNLLVENEDRFPWP